MIILTTVHGGGCSGVKRKVTVLQGGVEDVDGLGNVGLEVVELVGVAGADDTGTEVESELYGSLPARKTVVNSVS